MKQTISKLALTLGLILMFGSSAWAGTKSYTVECTVEGYEGTYKPGTTIEGNKIGYTIEQEYSVLQQGVSTDDDAETLTMQKLAGNPTGLNTGNITTYITARPVTGYDAAITVNSSTITIAYTKVYSTTYTVSCTNNGSSQTMGSGWTTYGYTIKKAYPANDEGISTSADETTLIIKNKNQEPTVLTTENILDYINVRTVSNRESRVIVDGKNITIQYGTETSQNYTVKCTLNGNSQTMNGTYGYTILKAYPANNEGVSTAANATTLTMKKWGSNPTTLTNDNINTYITARTVTMHNETCSVSVSVTGSNTKTITIAYTGPKEYTITSTGAPAGVTFVWKPTTGEVVGNKIYTSIELTLANLANYIALTGYDTDKYVVTPSISGTNITYAFAEIKTYNVSVTGTSAGGFTAKNGATKSGNTITVAANLSAANVADYVEAVKVDGYDAVVSWDGTNVTVTYTQLYKANYDVVCTVGGTTHALDNSYGYTVKTAYSASAEGVASAKNANPLVMQNLGEEPSPLTEENLNIYIAPITNANYDATMSIEGTTITIAYVVKPAESNTWTVTCTLNGKTQTMDGTYGYTVKASYDGSNTGIDESAGSKDDATSFRMKGAANEIDSITNANYTKYITIRQVEGCQVKVEIRRGTDHTIRIIYDNRFDLVENDLCYKITTTATTTTPGEVAVSLANYDATSVNVPNMVTIDGKDYYVTSIADYGFTDGFTNSSDSNRDSAIYPKNEDTYEFCRFLSGSDNMKVDSLNRHNPNPTGYDTYSRWCNAYNANLQEVTFDHPCYITKIGASAFEGCVNLQRFISPLSVETYGNKVFCGCKNMKTFKFETNDDGSAKLTVLPQAAFEGCQSLGTLRLPEGIVEIKTDALKYLLKLTSITLPSTLTTIGNEFLCTSLSLETLTLPAKVASIGGSAFHGCNALKSVYMLGDASALAAGSGSNKTFAANQAFCANSVQGCRFYTTGAYYDNYADKSSTWSQINQNGETNWLIAEIPGQTRTFVPGKWMTFCLPQSKIFFEFNGSKIEPTPGYQDDFGVKARPALTAGGDDTTPSRPALKVEAFENGWDYTADGKTIHYDGFGENCLVAKLEKVWLDATDRNLYHTQYRIIDHSEIKPYLPYFILPEIPVDPETKEPITDGEGKFPNLNICLWTSTDEVNGLETGWNAAQTAEHVFSMRCEDDTRVDDNPATIQWVAQVSRNEKLYPQDIYFKSNGKTGLKTNAEGKTEAEEIGKFYIIPDNSVTVKLKSCSAFWRVLQDGASSDVKLNSSKVRGMDIPTDPTSINEVENEKPVRVVIDGIYDMNGRKLNVSQDQLPDGMYIMDGKKVLKK